MLHLHNFLTVVFLVWVPDSGTPENNDSEKSKLLCRNKSLDLALFAMVAIWFDHSEKDASLNVCADCSMTPHDVKHLFVCPAHLTTMTPSILWGRPADAVLEFTCLEARDPD